MWMTLVGVKILKMRKSMRVILRNTMMRVEAPLLMPPVTAFTSAAMVGTGRGVGVVGGGTGRSSLQKIVTWNMCQQNINLKLWKMTRLIFWWRFPMQLLLSAFITVPI